MGAELLAAIWPLIQSFMGNTTMAVVDPNLDAAATKAAIEAETELLIKGTIETYERIAGKEAVLADRQLAFRRAEQSRDRTEQDILNR